MDEYIDAMRALWMISQPRYSEAMDVITSELEQFDRPSELGALEITMTPIGPIDRAIREQRPDPRPATSPGPPTG